MAAAMMAGNAEAAVSNAAKLGSQAWQSFKAKSPAVGKEAAIGIRGSTRKVKEVSGAPKQLTSHVGKTAGRNSAGRITIFHRGGGVKRLYRRIDMKRSTPAMGVIERIEYDPNRSSRIALVRWVEGAHQQFQKKSRAVEQEFVPPCKNPEPISTTTRGLFSLASLSRVVDQTKATSSPGRTGTYAVVGLQNAMTSESRSLTTIHAAGSKKTCVRDVFMSAFSSSRIKKGTRHLSPADSLNLPRIAVAGAKPAFFAPQIRDQNDGKSAFSLSEIEKWNPKSKVWDNRGKRKAAVPWHWQSFRWQGALGSISGSSF
ncbi:60S ribosomal protein L2, mitochondrial-like [Mercurialis annua]|uniref:60S ribosomal protein L2, mitochondrial-like n=1 Tax=Mercurialis annua TaxID=3986 RepID=UPI00215DDEBA|nr:60S ribosomal protein L2, mitochondrial-like [Mercurialis annua]